MVEQEREMTLSELSEQCLVDSQNWFGDSDVIYSISHHTLAMAGEVGEFANIVKKIERGSLDASDGNVRLDLAMELTDVFVYLLNIAALLQIDLYKSYQLVRSNNEERFTAQRKVREAESRPIKDNPQA